MERRIVRGAVVAAAFGISMTAFVGAARADCTSNADCKGGRVCVQGQCANAACSRDTDCPGDFVCNAGTCGRPSAAPAPVPAAPPAPAAAPPASAPPAPAPEPPPPATGTPAQVPGTAQALSGQETMVLDCSTAPNDPRCRGQKGVVFSQTFIFQKPPRQGVQFLIDGAYNHGFHSGANIFSGGLELGSTYFYGVNGPMPGPQGGPFAALIVEGVTGFFGGALVSTGSPTLASGAFLFRPALRLGFEYDGFGAFSAEKRLQRGVGVQVLYSLGGQYQFLGGDISNSSFDFAHGPVVGLMLGEWHPVDGELIRGFLRVSVLNVPSLGETYLLGGGGAAFP